jgi:hypothetical protein
LFDQALLAEGGQLNDPASFVKRMNQLLLKWGYFIDSQDEMPTFGLAFLLELDEFIF